MNKIKQKKTKEKPLLTFGKQYKGCYNKYGMCGHESANQKCPQSTSDDKYEKRKTKDLDNNEKKKKLFDEKYFHYGKQGHRICSCKKHGKDEKKSEKTEKVFDVADILVLCTITEAPEMKQETKRLIFANDVKFKNITHTALLHTTQESGMMCTINGENHSLL